MLIFCKLVQSKKLSSLIFGFGNPKAMCKIVNQLQIPQVKNNIKNNHKHV